MTASVTEIPFTGQAIPKLAREMAFSIKKKKSLSDLPKNSSKVVGSITSSVLDSPTMTAAAVMKPMLRLTAVENSVHENITTPIAQNGYYRVALLLPLSGEMVGIGQSLLNSAQMALFEATYPTLVLQIYDTQGSVDGATRAVKLAIAQGVRLVIGPLFSHEVKAISTRMRSLGVKVMAFTFTSDPTAATRSVFVVGHQIQQEVERIALFACSRGLTALAALAPDSANGQQAVTTLRNVIALTESCHISTVEFYRPDTTDFTSVVRRLVQKQPFNAVLIPDKGTKVKQIIPFLESEGLDLKKVKLLGTQLWADNIALHTDIAMAGSWYTAPFSQAQKYFAARYQKFFGLSPPSISSIAYDTVALAIALVRHGTLPDADSAIGFLAKDINFMGVNGLFRFQPTGILERGLAVIEISDDGTSRVISQAPEAFND